MRTHRVAWVFALALTACFRGGVDDGITVDVIRETRTENPDGSFTVARGGAADAVVAIVPVDTPKRDLAALRDAWTHARTDAGGSARFPEAKETRHVLVDVDGDGLVDGRALRAVPGRTTTVVVTGTAADASEWLKAETNESSYTPGATVRVALEGFLTAETDVTLEVWREADKRELLLSLPAGAFAGDVSATANFKIGAKWPLSAAQRLDDYLVVPKARGRYFDGARFSVRKAIVTHDMRGLALHINSGATTTTVRQVQLQPTGSYVSRVAFSENPADFPDGASKLVFKPGDYPFLLSAGDGRKTVWAMFFDADDNYAAPVSASITLDTKLYPTAITGIVFTINGGAPVTLSTSVRLQARAYGAQTVAFADDPALFLVSPLKFPVGYANYGYQLPTSNGVKTVWAQFYDANGFYAPPVSASIRLEEGFPLPADPALLYVVTRPPGQVDSLGGYAGAVAGFDPVSIYADRYETKLLAQGVANADGSFGPWSIGDGSAGNVEKPLDLVYVVRTDTFNRKSAPTAVTNDSTPPAVLPEHLSGIWYYDTKGQGVGNKGDIFEALVQIAFDYEPAQDVAGGIVDFRGMNGPAAVPLTPIAADQYAAFFTVPNNTRLDSDFLRYRAKVSDAAGNLSDWITPYGSFSIDTIPPREVVVEDYFGDNREFWVTWRDPNYDASAYLATFVDETGASQTFYVNIFDYCVQTNYYGNSCLAIAWYASGGSLPPGYGTTPGSYGFGVDNCHWYTVTIQAVDNGGNEGEYSTPVSDRVILPPPDFQAWGSFAQGGTGTLTWAMNTVMNASSYELHFDLDPGAPYGYTTSTGKTSPLPVTFSVEPYVQRLSGFPLRTNVYLSARALDGTCKSDYAPEMQVATDLRLEATSDGTPGESIGGSLAAVNDLDADGVTDILVGATLADYVAQISGTDGGRIGAFGSYIASEAYDFPGNPIAVADVDGDGLDEYLVGSPVDTFGGKQLAGAVRVYDDNGVLLKTLGVAKEGLHLGFSVARLGDLNGDGKEEFAAGGFGCAHRDCRYDPYTGEANEGPGQVIVYDGATLTALRTLTGPLKGDYFGTAVLGGADFDGDGVGDLVVGAPGSPSIASLGLGVFSGANGALIRYVDPKGTRYGSSLALLADQDGDGKPELVVGSPGEGDYGRVYAVSTTDFTSLRWQQDGRMTWTGSAFGRVVATGGDVNGDGTQDVVVGAPPRIQNYYYGTGAAYVLDGATGRFLYELRGTSVDGAIGYAVLAPGNLNAGPRDEWVVGAPGTSQGGYQAGRLYILTTDP